MADVVQLNGRDAPRLRTMPHNIEAEKSLFGGIFVESGNSIIEAVAGYLKPEHFAYEVHGRVFQAVLDLTGRGQIANPVTLTRFFETNHDLAGIGGAGYLAVLAASAVTPINAKETAKDITAAHGEVIAAMAKGEITPDDAAAIAGVLEARRRAIETVELEARIEEIEQRQSG